MWISGSLSSLEQTEICTGHGRGRTEAEGLTCTRVTHSGWQGVLIGAQASAPVGDSGRTAGALEKPRKRSESLALRFGKGEGLMECLRELNLR